ncbi:hypothetical protein [Streptomyces sp. V1I6]|uniref:hypothetical protein n=1 Tax=Streptomyces sp. V1I6 TaxID=3042273 RepID=UPI0027804F87|nr:hypothetical protein [Streptomyces sp. V1I6]MDQ0847786.1 hypothetical protein [Streptomyces sp. V1I6]
MSARTAETVSQLVSVLTVSARIAESGSVTYLPETVRPVGWAAHYVGAGQSWERVAEARVDQEVAPLLAGIARAEPRADVAHLYVSVESWRRAAVAETRRTASKEAYERVVGEMRREALAAIDAKGAAFQPVEWEESTRIFRVQGEWTVTVSASGTDHAAVREVFGAGLPGRRDEILADAQNRIPRVSGTVRAAADTPERVRKAWRRDRRRGTAPKPATGSYSPGSWVTWRHPETGRTLTGIVTKWLLGERTDPARRTVIPSDGGEPVVMVLDSGAKPTVGPWHVVYGADKLSPVQPGAEQLELSM